ncbi:MAG: hypothetical protein HDS42_00110 [Bacteroides sp.]|nr:hypothetical protein [Bacteroides sp.]
MNCGNFGDLTPIQIKAILQLTYQLIGCASYGRISEDDDASIDVMMTHLGMMGERENLGNLYWNEAVDMNPHHAFEIVRNLTPEKKMTFKKAINMVSLVDNQRLRADIARQIFSRIEA